MPHTSLAPTSHVTLAVRSAHASLLDPRFSSSPHSTETTGDDRTNVHINLEASRDWNIRISLHGYGGVELVPIDCRTPSAPLKKRSSETRDWFFRPTVSQATHDCRWDFVAKLPLRWRDLPRDAYLFFRVVQDNGDVVRRGTVRVNDVLFDESNALHNLTLPRFTRPSYPSLASMANSTRVCKRSSSVLLR